jgi:FAD-dependent halogenase
MNAHEQFDVIVVGGGPAGSTVASFVAMQGHRVLLLEREQFPRYQIGESLLPATINGICVMLGLEAELAAAGFPLKYGGTFRWGTSPEPWTFTFGPTTGQRGSSAFAYQVQRARFDTMLLQNARRKGVDVRERHAVREVLLDDDRVRGVAFTNPEGQRHTAEARFVVDASGHQTLISRNVGERVYSRFFQNLALFGYFEGGKRLPPPSDGNILVATCPEGWFWYIPLSPTLTSVGAVVAREHADKLKGDLDVALQRFIDGCPLIKEYLANATRVREGMYGQLRVRKEYSYCHRASGGPARCWWATRPASSIPSSRPACTWPPTRRCSPCARSMRAWATAWTRAGPSGSSSSATGGSSATSISSCSPSTT